MNINNFIYIVDINRKISSLLNKDLLLTTYGRVRQIRHKGLFLDLQDIYSEIQCMNLDIEKVKDITVGSLALVKGYIKKNNSGNIILETIDIELIKHSSLEVPTKHFAKNYTLKNRVMSLIVSEEVKRGVLAQLKNISIIRTYLSDKGFLEVETPILHNYPSGAIAEPFKTHMNALHKDFYLRIAPELFLKRLLVAGFNKIFEIATCFRNEGISYKHNPEFKMVEIYGAYMSRDNMITIVEDIVSLIFNIKVKWEKISYKDYPKFSENDIENLIKSDLVKYKYVHIIDHPKESCGLAKVSEDGIHSLRFESYINGIEIANGYNEQDDHIIQKKLMPEIEDEYIEDLSIGMPPSSGLGIGINRLTMISEGLSNIKHTIMFPN